MKENALPSASRSRRVVSAVISHVNATLGIAMLALASLAPSAYAVGPSPAWAQARAAEAASRRLLLGPPHAIGDLIAVDVALHNVFTDDVLYTIRQGTP